MVELRGIRPWPCCLALWCCALGRGSGTCVPHCHDLIQLVDLGLCKDTILLLHCCMPCGVEVGRLYVCSVNAACLHVCLGLPKPRPAHDNSCQVGGRLSSAYRTLPPHATSSCVV